MQNYLQGVLAGVFPKVADNNYRGHPIAFYALILLLAQQTFRSWVHMFWEDGGLNSIATIKVFPGNPDPNEVMYMLGAQWGSVQIVLVLIYLLILVRYRSLIPLAFLILLTETLMRFWAGLLHPITPEHYITAPPGLSYLYLMLPVALIMLHFSTRVKPDNA